MLWVEIVDDLAHEIDLKSFEILNTEALKRVACDFQAITDNLCLNESELTGIETKQTGFLRIDQTLFPITRELRDDLLSNRTEKKQESLLLLALRGQLQTGRRYSYGINITSHDEAFLLVLKHHGAITDICTGIDVVHSGIGGTHCDRVRG